MEIIKYSKNIILPKKKRYIALGVFDGVHLGHKKLIKLASDKAKKNDGISIVVTFDPHPDKIIKPESKVFLKELFVGFNYKFGFQGKGNTNILKEYSKLYKFKTNILKPISAKNTIISSTIIKDYIRLGEIEKARKLLGHNITIFGRVVSGKGRGRKLLNFATANIKTATDKILPVDGVYLVEIEIDNKKYYGLMNIGIKPTFKETERTIEVHIINFNEKIYNKKVIVNILQKIREEKYFCNTNLLKKQIEEDILIAYKIIAKNN